MQKTMSKILSGTMILKARIIPASFAYKGLPKSINNYFKSHARLLNTPENFIEQLFIAVLDRFDLSPGSEEVPKPDKAHRGIVNPQIVLTQSFS